MRKIRFKIFFNWLQNSAVDIKDRRVHFENSELFAIEIDNSWKD